jgi:hypothetical protein
MLVLLNKKLKCYTLNLDDWWWLVIEEFEITYNIRVS